MDEVYPVKKSRFRMLSGKENAKVFHVDLTLQFPNALWHSWYLHKCFIYLFGSILCTSRKVVQMSSLAAWRIFLCFQILLQRKEINTHCMHLLQAKLVILREVLFLYLFILIPCLSLVAVLVIMLRQLKLPKMVCWKLVKLLKSVVKVHSVVLLNFRRVVKDHLAWLLWTWYAFCWRNLLS